MSTNNPFSLEGKTILVTGASSGIGRSTAIECSKMGGKIILNGRNLERLNEVLTNLEGEGHKILSADVTRQDDLDYLVNVCPLLNGVVMCAGITKMLPTKLIKRDDINTIFETNIASSILLASGLLKKKKINPSSSFVFISSIASQNASVGNGIYAASKGALNSFVKVLALETANRNIRANCILPGIVKTSMNEEGMKNGDYDDLAKKYPLGFGNPENIAKGVVFLLSDASSWITGTNIVVDGGYSLNY